MFRLFRVTTRFSGHIILSKGRGCQTVAFCGKLTDQARSLFSFTAYFPFFQSSSLPVGEKRFIPPPFCHSCLSVTEISFPFGHTGSLWQVIRKETEMDFQQPLSGMTKAESSIIHLFQNDTNKITRFAGVNPGCPLFLTNPQHIHPQSEAV